MDKSIDFESYQTFTYSSKKNTASHPKVLHWIEQTEMNAEMDKADSEQSNASERSTGNFFKYCKVFHKSSLPSRLKYKNGTADTDPLKAELFLKFSASITLNCVRFQKHPSLISIQSLTQLLLLISRYVKYVNRWTRKKVMAPTIYCQYCSIKYKHLYLILSIAAIVSPIHKKTIKVTLKIIDPSPFFV